MSLQEHFAWHRRHIVGIDAVLSTPFGVKPLTYLDWTAMGREDCRVGKHLMESVAKFGNTHSETNFTGEFTTGIYQEAHDVIGRHVNAAKSDIVLFKGSGMTGAINWLQYMLGLRDSSIPVEDRPVVLVTHLEHHSNQTSWEECDALVRIVGPGPDGLPDLNQLEDLCKQYGGGKRKLYGSFTACSNVTGVKTDPYAMAKIIHRYGGHIFIDYAASAPYSPIDMHPDDPEASLDAIVFSPHKFLGGPGSAGVIVLNSRLYDRKVPVNVGGGIVAWTNPWGGHSFYDDIQVREDAGTPQIVQGFRAALAVKLKEALDPALIAKRKAHLLKLAFDGLDKIPGVEVLARQNGLREGIVSFTVQGIHYGLVVRLLNDLAGVQVRGGCSCAGTYGHYLFGIGVETSNQITDLIDHGDNSCKPGWVRASLHPTMTEEELSRFLGTLEMIVAEVKDLRPLYVYDEVHNSWHHGNYDREANLRDVKSYFEFGSPVASYEL